MGINSVYLQLVFIEKNEEEKNFLYIMSNLKVE